MSGYKNYATTQPRTTNRFTPDTPVVHGRYSDREAIGSTKNANWKSNSGLKGGTAYRGKLF